MSFTCEDIQSRWAEYLYRELDEPDQSQFVRHIERCSRCRAEEAEWRALISRFDAIAASDGITQAPKELVFRVKRQTGIYEDWSRQSRMFYRNRLLGAVASFILFLAGIAIAMNQVSSLGKKNAFLQPLSNTVLGSLYSPNALEIFHSEGLLQFENEDNSERVTGLKEST